VNTFEAVVGDSRPWMNVEVLRRYRITGERLRVGIENVLLELEQIALIGWVEERLHLDNSGEHLEGEGDDRILAPVRLGISELHISAELQSMEEGMDVVGLLKRYFKLTTF